MSKLVKEKTFKAYSNFEDAHFEINGWNILVDVEGHIPPQSVSAIYNGVSKSYRLKPFRRTKQSGSYFELVYILIGDASE